MWDVAFNKGRFGYDVLRGLIFCYIFGVLDVRIVDLLEALFLCGCLLSASFDHDTALWSRKEALRCLSAFFEGELRAWTSDLGRNIVDWVLVLHTDLWTVFSSALSGSFATFEDMDWRLRRWTDLTRLHISFDRWLLITISLTPSDYSISALDLCQCIPCGSNWAFVLAHKIIGQTRVVMSLIDFFATCEGFESVLDSVIAIVTWSWDVKLV